MQVLSIPIICNISRLAYQTAGQFSFSHHDFCTTLFPKQFNAAGLVVSIIFLRILALSCKAANMAQTVELNVTVYLPQMPTSVCLNSFMFILITFNWQFFFTRTIFSIFVSVFLQKRQFLYNFIAFICNFICFVCCNALCRFRNFIKSIFLNKA